MHPNLVEQAYEGKTHGKGLIAIWDKTSVCDAIAGVILSADKQQVVGLVKIQSISADSELVEHVRRHAGGSAAQSDLYANHSEIEIPESLESYIFSNSSQLPKTLVQEFENRQPIKIIKFAPGIIAVHDRSIKAPDALAGFVLRQKDNSIIGELRNKLVGDKSLPFRNNIEPTSILVYLANAKSQRSLSRPLIEELEALRPPKVDRSKRDFRSVLPKSNRIDIERHP